MPLAGLWLCGYIRCPWGFVRMKPLGMASPWCRLLYAYLSPFPLRAMLYLPCLFVPPVGFLCIFTRLLTCPCMSLACLCVVHASTQWSYGHSIQTYICPSRTPPFVHFLAYLPFCLFACFIAPLLAMPIMLIRFMPFHMLFTLLPYIACLLVFLSLPLHVHTLSEDAWS